MDHLNKLSIIVPCHNEAGSIGPVLQSLRDLYPAAELLVIDDGSTDDTVRAAEAVAGIRLVRHETNLGKGAALRRGIAEAQGEVLAFIDGDGQDDPADLKLLLDQIELGRDFVNGSKFVGAIKEGGISLPNYWGNRFMSGLINLFFGGKVTDSQSGFRVVTRKLIRNWSLVSTQYEIETEMLIKALKAGARIKEVPVTRAARTAGSTGFLRVRNGLRILMTIFRERFFSR